ncbi:hypothetical protein SAMN04488568_12911 [Maricaulis salignorans]|uniref:Uncharacterized protein n=1 Tax=Maricaulis salignorans TaxID=144026 RepID=A0A1G9WW73_9PROT|nr:hypothetical protein SAMN04488568_12911 [Maricaulis salignorans]
MKYESGFNRMEVASSYTLHMVNSASSPYRAGNRAWQIQGDS